jgi:hypothetical protein
MRLASERSLLYEAIYFLEVFVFDLQNKHG